MSRSWKLFLRDMLESARKTEMMYDAVLYNLQILGEAAKKIPDPVRERYPEIDWRGVAGLRDVLRISTSDPASSSIPACPPDWRRAGSGSNIWPVAIST